jgi:hypothetical protein
MEKMYYNKQEAYSIYNQELFDIDIDIKTLFCIKTEIIPCVSIENDPNKNKYFILDLQHLPNNKEKIIKEIENYLNTLLSNDTYCKINNNNDRLSVKYYYKNNNYMFKRVPIIKEYTRLYIERSDINVNYTNEDNNKYIIAVKRMEEKN